MFRLKIRRIDKGLGFTLPDEVAARLGVREGDSLRLVDCESGGYRIESMHADPKQIMALARRIMNRYRNTLRDLSK